MAIKDYFSFFTSLHLDEFDYLISFDINRPVICNYPELFKIGTWHSYSHNGYRLLTKLDIDSLLDLIHEQTKITKSKIHITLPANNIYMR